MNFFLAVAEIVTLAEVFRIHAQIQNLV